MDRVCLFRKWTPLASWESGGAMANATRGCDSECIEVTASRDECARSAGNAHRCVGSTPTLIPLNPRLAGQASAQPMESNPRTTEAQPERIVCSLYNPNVARVSHEN